MDLTSVYYINNAFKKFVMSRLHSGMCKKIRVNREYRELKEDVSVRSTYMESLTWVQSFCSNFDLESMVY